MLSNSCKLCLLRAEASPTSSYYLFWPWVWGDSRGVMASTDVNNRSLVLTTRCIQQERASRTVTEYHISGRFY